MNSRDKIDIYKELQKELEDRKKKQVFYQQEHIVIEFDGANGWICADWIGYQTEATVQDGCTHLLEAVKKFNTGYILNDNSHVLGIWTPAVDWLGNEWFPQMLQAGMKKFAWVYSPSALSQFSTNETLKIIPDTEQIRTFYSIEEAKAWLKEVVNHAPE